MYTSNFFWNWENCSLFTAWESSRIVQNLDVCVSSVSKKSSVTFEIDLVASIVLSVLCQKTVPYYFRKCKTKCTILTNNQYERHDTPVRF